MNFVNLKTFLAISETGSLIRASERLNVTQSTVTARLQALETELGQTLFIRQKTGATLTAPGIKLRRYAQTMVELWRQARQETSLPEGVEAVCNIGCPPDLWPIYGRTLLSNIRKINPAIALSNWSGSNSEIAAWLDNGLVDIALTTQPATQLGRILHALPVEKLILVGTQPDRPIRFDPNYVFVELGDAFGRDHATYYADAGIAKLNFSSPIWALEYLLENDGTAYLPANLVAPFIVQKRLFKIPQAPEFSRSIHFITSEKAAAAWHWINPVIDRLKSKTA